MAAARPLWPALLLLCALTPTLFAQPPDEEKPVTIAFSGVVRDEAGAPVEDAQVVAVRIASDVVQSEDELPPLAAAFSHAAGKFRSRDSRQVARLRTGEDGAFSFRTTLTWRQMTREFDHLRGSGMSPSVHIAAFTPDLASSMWIKGGFIPEAASAAEPVTIILYPRARLKVRLVDHENKPLAGQPVVVGERIGSWCNRFFVGKGMSMRAGGPLRFEAATDDNGWAWFRPSPGVDLYVNCPRLGMCTVADRPRLGTLDCMLCEEGLMTPLRLSRGETRELIVRRPRLVRIKGTVTRQNGEPVADASIGYLSMYPRPEWRSMTDAKGQFTFKEPLPPGGPVFIHPQEDKTRFHQETIEADPDGGDVDAKITLAGGCAILNVNRTDCEVLLGSREAKSTERRNGVLRARFSWWMKVADVVVVADTRQGPRIGFHVQRNVRVDRPEITVEVPDFAFDASLDLSLEAPPGRKIDGAVYLACTSVDRHMGVPVFAEVVVAGAAHVEVDKLQAGRYLLGFVPYEGNEALFRTPGEPRPVLPTWGHQVAGHWHRAFGTLAKARRRAWWRPVRIKPGRNHVVLDLGEPTHGGRLEIVPVDRNGETLMEYRVELNSEDHALLEHRSWFIADHDGVVRIEKVPPGLYAMWLHRGGALEPGRQDCVIIPSHGVHRRKIAFDVKAPDTPLPPLLIERAILPTAAETKRYTALGIVQEAARHVSRGETDRAREIAISFYAKDPEDGNAAAALMTLFGGQAGVTPGIPFRPADAERLGLAKRLGERPSLEAVLEALWANVTKSDAYRDQVLFRFDVATLRLEQLLRHGWEVRRNRDAFQKLMRQTREALAATPGRWEQHRYGPTLEKLAGQAEANK